MNAGHAQIESALIASAKIYQQLINQSAILAYADAFRFLATVTLVLAVIALMMPSNLVAGKISTASVADH